MCDFGYKSLATNTKVSFYDSDPRIGVANKIDQTYLLPDSILGSCCGRLYTQILDVTYPRLNQIYAVVNDAGNVTPISLPNTGINEKTYFNNVAVANNFRFKVSVNPSTTIIRPGNTLPLVATTAPDATFTSKFLWSPSNNLSCTGCATTIITADSNTTKRVIATSAYQCFDTAYVSISIPPDDFFIQVNGTSCSPNEDSIIVDFTIKNQLTTGIIPKNLKVAFYSNDPTLATTTLLPPVFNVSDSVLATEKRFQVKIKKLIGSNLFASVNDDGKIIPVQTSRAFFSEYEYKNNFTKFAFLPSTTVPVTICDGTNYFGYTKPGTYVNTFTSANYCDSVRTLILSVNPNKFKTNNIKICRGDTYLAAGSLQTIGGIYTDTLKTSVGCDSIVITNLVVNELPANFLPLDTILCTNSSLQIQLNGFNKVIWNTGSTSSALKINQPGTYIAEVTDKNGCIAADTLNVLYKKCIPIQVPNAFSPNSDGKNDIFKPLIGVEVTNYHLQIWNRWGQLLFETRNYTEGWNGRYNSEIQSNGTYVYYISFLDLDGNAYSKTGSFVLIK